MVGLVFVDSLSLTWPQWIGLLWAMGVLLHFSASWRVLGLVHAGLLAVFGGAALSTDTRLLFQSAEALHGLTWGAFLTEFAFADYVKLQPPFYTFWLSCWPSLFLHQVFQALLAVGVGRLMVAVYGDRARYLLGTPVYLLLSTQPGNDYLLFVGLLGVLRCVQTQRRGAAALLLGLLYPLKPLMMLTLPLFVRSLRGWLLVSAVFIGGYVAWSQSYYFGVSQWTFLLWQVSGGLFGR